MYTLHNKTSGINPTAHFLSLIYIYHEINAIIQIKQSGNEAISHSLEKADQYFLYKSPSISSVGLCQ